MQSQFPLYESSRQLIPGKRFTCTADGRAPEVSIRAAMHDFPTDSTHSVHHLGNSRPRDGSQDTFTAVVHRHILREHHVDDVRYRVDHSAALVRLLITCFRCVV